MPTTKQQQQPRAKRTTAPATVQPQNPVVSMITAVERYAGSAPSPKLVIYFAAGTPARTMNAIMFRVAAAVELATPERERWIVRADHRGAHDRMTVHLELATGSDDEVDRGIAVLQPIATRGEVL